MKGRKIPVSQRRGVKEGQFISNDMGWLGRIFHYHGGGGGGVPWWCSLVLMTRGGG